MSELYSIFLSAVFSSFIVTMGIVAVVGSLYYLTFKCFASYISFDKIAHKHHLNSKTSNTQENSAL
ncbi:putative membrane protein [Sulfurospirillum multivorans DSM 12446]|uniref:Membrane protein n=2 Tax=Sulfurospirillum multivorans TaxID=66821 RepID=A0AA86AMJ7_SULMK|nr:putative membrane protein [Sulfurospirillum multivorans DSM 12446]QEH06966.1 putative membrane protein [Sulfurospirillum multivorans]